MSKDLKQDFSLLGLSHIVAISGLHIGILFGFLMYFLIYIGFWRRQAFWISSFLIFLYILLIGAPPSAVRAFLMIFILFFAYTLRRLIPSYKTLTFSAAFLLLINPKLLRDDIGFQLSFLAVLGIILFYEKIDDFLAQKGVGNFAKLRNIFALSTSAQILNLPLLFYYFHYVSFVSPFVNLAVVPILPVLLILLISAIALSLIFPGFAFIFFSPAYFILFYIVKLTHFLASFLI